MQAHFLVHLLNWKGAQVGTGVGWGVSLGPVLTSLSWVKKGGGVRAHGPSPARCWDGWMAAWIYGWMNRWRNGFGQKLDRETRAFFAEAVRIILYASCRSIARTSKGREVVLRGKWTFFVFFYVLGRYGVPLAVGREGWEASAPPRPDYRPEMLCLVPQRVYV